jgi:short-subunit dehydrogenase
MTSRASSGVVVITGASSGLGAEMARQFSALNYDLALCARRADRLEVLAGEIVETTGRSVTTAALDVTDPAAVASTFSDFVTKLGTIDRVIVNAGIGSGAALGTGRFDVNLAMVMTNFVGALAQVEAAMEIFRRQSHGHLVLISSMAAMRGMSKSMTTYSATKAALATVAEGLRAENIKGVDVSVIYPGYIRSEMNADVADQVRFMVDTETGVRAMVDAIERRRVKAFVPAWPWLPLGVAMKVLPLPIARRLA